MIAVREAGAIVLGSGLAGLTAALALASVPTPAPVLVLTKTAGLAGGSSLWAQGGVAAALGPGDGPADHAADTVAAGAGLVDAAAAGLLAEEGAARVRDLLASGAPFDRAADGAPLLGREAAHGRARIVHAGGDATGRLLVGDLVRRLASAPSVRVGTEAFAADLVVRDGRVCGVLAFHRRGGWIFHRCGRVVLATGGIGAAWLRTTNPPEATGDGLAMAARAGAVLADPEFVQFHPTALAAGGTSARMPLLTEALRGAGAVLVDGAGRRFMPDEHPDAELAPRDVVARAVWRRVAAGEPVLLDMRAVLAGRPDGFPTVRAVCAEAGFDPAREPVPVAPAAHYHMGGVATDDLGRSSVAGLWACGEVASTGVHGANRLASNSLLEALVFGARVAADVAGRALPAPPPVAVPAVPAVPDEALSADLAAGLRTTLYEGAGLVRDADGLGCALDRIARDEAALAAAPGGASGYEAVRRWGEARNLLLVGRLVARAALDRQESRGAHFRRDFPTPAAEARRRFLTLGDVSGVPAPDPLAAQPMVKACSIH
ncbi:L-aspartate oxidase [Arenibaculum sp.]|uniref:L-aspartate oxidase n=1 Tax=Arenibaculum sp. TaxID=2865862 RepID=UPI002E0DE7F5|nr:L-aspartate oxidase [Arenibaculum sp.]